MFTDFTEFFVIHPWFSIYDTAIEKIPRYSYVVTYIFSFFLFVKRMWLAAKTLVKVQGGKVDGQRRS